MADKIYKKLREICEYCTYRIYPNLNSCNSCERSWDARQPEIDEKDNQLKMSASCAGRYMEKTLLESMAQDKLIKQYANKSIKEGERIKELEAENKHFLELNLSHVAAITGMDEKIKKLRRDINAMGLV